MCNVYNMKGLKTGMYYLRTRPAANAIQFTVDKSRLRQHNQKSVDEASDAVAKQTEAMLMCSLQNRESCVMCSSWNCNCLSSRPVVPERFITCTTLLHFTCQWWCFICQRWIWSAFYANFLCFICGIYLFFFNILQWYIL